MTLNKILRAIAVATTVSVCVQGSNLAAADPTPDAAKHTMEDELLDHLVGEWKLTGKVMGRAVENHFTASWVLGHQFLLLHFKDVASPPTYEAEVYLGFDNTKKVYLAHWLDVYGGKFSETLGYGTREGNKLRLDFDYPDGKFRDTFAWDAVAQTWHFELKSQTTGGEWEDFAIEDLQRTSQP